MRTAAILLALVGLFGVTASSDVVNGDFETGDFTGWTTFGDLSFTGVSGLQCPNGASAAMTACTPYDGSYSAFFGQTGATGGISQAITTVAGASYTVYYWFEVDPANSGTSPANYAFSWNGTNFASATDPDKSGWTKFTFTGLVAGGDSTVLMFTTYNYPDWFGLDDVTVTEEQSETPEPASLAVSALGLLLLGAARFRRTARG